MTRLLARGRRALHRVGRRPGPPLYRLLMVGGAALVDLGVALVFLPAAVVLAGLAIGAVGLFGLGMKETS